MKERTLKYTLRVGIPGKSQYDYEVLEVAGTLDEGEDSSKVFDGLKRFAWDHTTAAQALGTQAQMDAKAKNSKVVQMKKKDEELPDFLK